MIYQVLVKNKDGKMVKKKCKYENIEIAHAIEESMGNRIYVTWTRL